MILSAELLKSTSSWTLEVLDGYWVVLGFCLVPGYYISLEISGVCLAIRRYSREVPEDCLFIRHRSLVRLELSLT